MGRRSCEITMEEKHPCHTKLCAFRCLILGTQNIILRSRNQIQNFSGNYFFLGNYVTSVSHNVYTINSSPLLVTK